ncbi:glycosyltransferase [Saccharothrix sp. SC076]|nr:glycosyltransferase [Saccharothrix obliqua]
MVVVTWRGREHITACLDALARQRPHRAVVVDNASDDGTAALIATHPSAPRVVRLSRNRGYAGALAAVLPHVDTEFVAWLNDDAAPEDTWLAHLEDALRAAPAAAAATSALLRADGSTQSVGVRLTADGHGADVVTGHDVFGFCGGAALLRTAALRAAGGVPGGFFCYYEDTDTAWRLRLAGHDVLSVAAARVHHRHGASTRPGSRRFHRWNERNRLLALLRCAPPGVAVGQVARFAALTAALPLRRGPRPWNFRVGLRLQVLAEVVLRLPATIGQRIGVTRRSTVPRTAVWRVWAGR